MTTPALMRLREKFPDAHITLLTPEKLADLWRHHPSIDSVITFTAGESPLLVALKLRSLNPKRFDELPEVLPGDTLARVFARVMAGVFVRVANTLSASAFYGRLGFDLALVLPNSPRSALEVWLARIPQRIGYARPWRNWFLTARVAPRPDAVKMRKRTPTEIHQLIQRPVSEIGNASAHQIHEYLHLVAALGASPEPMPPQLVVTPDEIEAVKKKFGLNVIGRTIFGLNPGAEYGPAKRWPVEKFIFAAQQIQQRTNCTWVLFGSQADVPISSRIESVISGPSSAIWNLAGKTGLRELMALLKLCRVLLTNDSGPMHVAAALGTPVVVPFGSTSPELTGPGLPGDARHRLLKSDAPCAPCFLRECPIDFRCLNGISVERVVEAVLETIR